MIEWGLRVHLEQLKQWQRPFAQLSVGLHKVQRAIISKLACQCYTAKQMSMTIL